MSSFAIPQMIGVPALLLMLATAPVSATSQPMKLIYPNPENGYYAKQNFLLIGEIDSSQVALLCYRSDFSREVTFRSRRQLDLAEFARQLSFWLSGSLGITHLHSTSTEISGQKKLLLDQTWNGNGVTLADVLASEVFRKLHRSIVTLPEASPVLILVSGLATKYYYPAEKILPTPCEGYFVLQSNLVPGENLLELFALSTNQDTLAFLGLELYTPEKLLMNESAELPDLPEFHNQESSRLCEGCHRMKFSRLERSSRTITAVNCFPCHRGVLENSFIHGPVAEWKCLFCHEAGPQSTGSIQLRTRDTLDELCFECHTELQSDLLTANYLHGPVSSGNCAICHDSHSTNFPAQTLMPIPDLCTSCHEDKYLQNHPVEKHPSAGSGLLLEDGTRFNCCSCHNPHGGQDPYMFVYDHNATEICLECHKK